MQWLAGDVGTTLLQRGWVVANPHAAYHEPLEWFWPPTAPLGHAGLPEWQHAGARARPQLYGRRQTPWIVPTRILRVGDAWRVRYGTAIAQAPDADSDFSDDADMLSCLEAIECWPLTLEATARIRDERIVAMVTAFARDDHYLAMTVTEPYGSRLDAIQEQRWAALGASSARPSSPRRPGSLDAQWILADADAWASAVRTARAGGDGWGVNGPQP